MGNLKGHTSCESCGSKDNMAVYTSDYVDGEFNGYCYGCTAWKDFKDIMPSLVSTSSSTARRQLDLESFKKYPLDDMPDRGIRKATAMKYGVRSANGMRYFPVYATDGELLGYKRKEIATKKIINLLSKPAKKQFFGQHQFKGGGRRVIITVGEEDAMAAYQMTGLKSAKKVGYPCVSFPNGCKDLKCVSDNLDWLESFESVIFAVDQEEGDLSTARKACELLTPGKGKVATFSENDANDMLRAHKINEFWDAIWNAGETKPSGIFCGEELWAEWKKKDEYHVIPWPEGWGLNEITKGLYYPSIFTIAAGTGVGKSTIMKHLQMHLFNNTEDSVGIISLEEPLHLCAGILMGMYLNKRILVPGEEVSEAEEKRAFNHLFGQDRFVFCDNTSIRTEQDLFVKVRHMAKAHGCRFIFLDHITAMVNKIASKDHIKHTETLVNALNDLSQELGVCIIIVSHVRKRKEDQRSYESGAVPDEDSMFGSSSLKQYSHCTIVMSRDKMKDEPMFIHVLKDRLTGKTGTSNGLIFNPQTGWLMSVEDVIA